MPTKISPLAKEKLKKASELQLPQTLKNKVTLFVLIGLAVAVFITGLIILILFAAVPCRFKSCHANATCINRPYNAKCKCNKGFNGNGIDCDECGVAYPTPLDYDGLTAVVNISGEIIQPFSYPATTFFTFSYVSYVHVGDREYQTAYSSQCNGILINRRTILTAASCIVQSYDFVLTDMENKTIRVVVALNEAYPHLEQMYNIFTGVNQYIALNVDIFPVRQLALQEIIIHDGYSPLGMNENIALIKLKKSIVLDQYVQLACIPDHEDHGIESQFLAYNTSAVTIGWEPYFSRFNQGVRLADFPQNILNVNNCTGLFPTDTRLEEIICSGIYKYLPLNPSSGPGRFCQGDIGSALYVNRTYNGVRKNFAIGIGINDTQCGLGAFTNLFHFAEWIEEYSDY